MAARTSYAEWKGDLQAGEGTMRLGSGAFEGGFSFKSRFAEGENGTNPEELIAAAHAGCFSMALSNILATDGHVPTSVNTEAHVTLGTTDAGPTITKITLTTTGDVPGLTENQFQEYAQKAKAGCLVSRALAGVETIDLRAKLA